MEMLGTILIIIFFICAFIYFFASARLIFFILRQKCGLPFMYLSAPGWAMQHYVDWCKENSVEPNQAQLLRYQRSVKILGYAIVFLITGLLFLIVKE